MIGKYNLVRLEMPPYDAEKFRCLTDSNCENPQVSGWAVGEVAVAVVTDLRDKAPNVADFLSQVAGAQRRDQRRAGLGRRQQGVAGGGRRALLQQLRRDLDEMGARRRGREGEGVTLSGDLAVQQSAN